LAAGLSAAGRDAVHVSAYKLSRADDAAFGGEHRAELGEGRPGLKVAQRLPDRLNSVERGHG
jgi:hypothetical protein